MGLSLGNQKQRLHHQPKSSEEKKLVCTDFAFKLPSCSSRHILKDSHLASAFPEKRCLFLNIRISRDAKAHLKIHIHRAALLPTCSHAAPQTLWWGWCEGQLLEPTAVAGCRDAPTTPKARGQCACTRQAQPCPYIPPQTTANFSNTTPYLGPEAQETPDLAALPCLWQKDTTHALG